MTSIGFYSQVKKKLECNTTGDLFQLFFIVAVLHSCKYVYLVKNKSSHSRRTVFNWEGLRRTAGGLGTTRICGTQGVQTSLQLY